MLATRDDITLHNNAQLKTASTDAQMESRRKTQSGADSGSSSEASLQSVSTTNQQ